MSKVIKASTVDPVNLFNFDGLDYQKGLWMLYYDTIRVDSVGEIEYNVIRVGIRSKLNLHDVLTSPSIVSLYNDGTTDYSDLDTLVEDITGLITAVDDSGSGGIKITQKASNYSALVAGTDVGDIAYVEASQGTKWLPGTLMGTYYPAGWYVWDGSLWNSDRNAIANELENITTGYVQSNLTGEPSGSDQVLNMVSLTQAEYDAGTPVAGTFYNITDASSGGSPEIIYERTGVLLDSPDVLKWFGNYSLVNARGEWNQSLDVDADATNTGIESIVDSSLRYITPIGHARVAQTLQNVHFITGTAGDIIDRICVFKVLYAANRITILDIKVILNEAVVQGVNNWDTSDFVTDEDSIEAGWSIYVVFKTSTLANCSNNIIELTTTKD